MQAELLNMGLAFLEGFALIISPCILPILPLILTGSLTGSKTRPIGIIVGFILTFTIVTLFSRFIVQVTHITPDLLRDMSFIILFIFGCILLSNHLSEKFAALTGRFMNVGNKLSKANNHEGGFFSGVLFGGLIGIVWTPCAGPILAAVIVQVIVQQTYFSSLLIVSAFALGVSVPMLLIAFLGRSIVDQFAFFRRHSILIRRILGLILILSVFLAAFYPATLPKLLSQDDKVGKVNVAQLIGGLAVPYKAPEIAGINHWINSPPLTLEQLKGKVVLIDFWTYSCINCIRTIPYLNEWYQKYHHLGFEIIGVHTPEFEFEKEINNVNQAVKNFNIKYPVAMDNQYVTWQNYNNRYWPAHYLINADGVVVYEHFGEGAYADTENNIRFLLGLNKTTGSHLAEVRPTFLQTPETYLGYRRAANNANANFPVKHTPYVYTAPSSLMINQWALNGNWTVNSNYIISNVGGASVTLHFYAKSVYVVMGSTTDSPISVDILINDKKIKTIEVDATKLYTIIELPQVDDEAITLNTNSPGLTIYTFTFG